RAQPADAVGKRPPPPLFKHDNEGEQGLKRSGKQRSRQPPGAARQPRQLALASGRRAGRAVGLAPRPLHLAPGLARVALTCHVDRSKLPPPPQSRRMHVARASTAPTWWAAAAPNNDGHPPRHRKTRRTSARRRPTIDVRRLGGGAAGLRGPAQASVADPLALLRQRLGQVLAGPVGLALPGAEAGQNPPLGQTLPG